MNVKEIIEEMDTIVGGMYTEDCAERRSKMYDEWVEQLFAIREALGLPLAICMDCGDDGGYECMDCHHEYCGLCGSMVQGRFLCRSCQERSVPQGMILKMTGA